MNLAIGCMLSVGTIRFEDRFCASKKDGIGEVGRFQYRVPCTWQLSWLAVEKPSLVPCRKMGRSLGMRLEKYWLGHFSPF